MEFMDNRGKTLLMIQRLIARLRRRRDFSVWEQYRVAAKGLNFSKTALFLSFDCDTDPDAAAGLELVSILSGLGIKASFAVPGVQLLANRNVYQRIAAQGVEFLNHGYRSHTDWDGLKYYAVTFYNEMSRREVEEDIRRADAVIREVAGRPPAGFRAPHFGSFQKSEEVAFMHNVCADLGYTYASTTLPVYAFERGPAFLSCGLVEFPVIGSWRIPHTILDSWNYLEDRVNYRLSESYFDLFAETITMSRKKKLPLLLTWYTDPSHVLGQKPFIKAMEFAAAQGIPSFTGSECAACFGARLRGGICAV
jgi:hypothetical protein